MYPSPIVIACLVVSLVVWSQPTSANLNPIIVQHGLMGGIIEIQATNASMPNQCPVTFPRTRMWLNFERLAVLNCWKAALLLNVNADGSSQNPTGLQGFVPDNGIAATSCLEPSTDTTCRQSAYLKPVYDFLTSKGYEAGKTLDAVAYDWRNSPIDFVKPGDYFSRLKGRVEKMFNETGKKVTILGHSMGGATTALFLGTFVDAAWKEKYIHMFISIAGAYGGSLAVLKGIITGNRDDLISAETSRELSRSFPGAHSLAPANTASSKPYGTAALVRLGTEDFGVDDLPALYTKVGLANYSGILNRLRGGYQVPPGVVTHCIFGAGFPTLSKITFPDPNNLSSFTEEFTDGDGTLVTASQRVCANFSTRQSQTVTTLDIRATHTGLLSNTDVLNNVFLRVNNRAPTNASLSPQSVAVASLALFVCAVFL